MQVIELVEIEDSTKLNAVFFVRALRPFDKLKAQGPLASTFNRGFTFDYSQSNSSNQ
jgi:hypothetical protein